jgi:hypothetical protein
MFFFMFPVETWTTSKLIKIRCVSYKSKERDYVFTRKQRLRVSVSTFEESEPGNAQMYFLCFFVFPHGRQKTYFGGSKVSSNTVRAACHRKLWQLSCRQVIQPLLIQQWWKWLR